MESINEVFAWLAEYESAFSAVAALLVIFGVVFSPLGAGMRGCLFRLQRPSSIRKSGAILGATRTQMSVSVAQTNTAENNDKEETSLLESSLNKDRPVVAVLPFTNMSADEEQGYLAEGMTEDIITLLARSADMDVIARNSTFMYQGTAPDIRRVGRDLGARYVVEGSLRKVGSGQSGQRVRVTVQLIEAATGSHVWAENYDRPLSEIFTIQDEVSSGIASALGYAIIVAEIDAANKSSSTDNLDAWGLVARSLSAAFQYSSETATASVEFARQAVALDPNYAAAHARLASALIRRPINNFSENPELDTTEAENAINRAMQLAPNDPGVLAEYGHVLCFSGHPDEAVAVIERALALCPSNAITIALYGYALGMIGDYDKGLAELDRAAVLLPNAQYLYRIYFWRSTTLVCAGRYAEGEIEVRKSISIFGGFHTAIAVLAMCLAGQNKNEQALAALSEAVDLVPDLSPDQYRLNISSLYPAGVPENMARVLAAIEKIWLQE